jgi:Cys-tRNA(Pro)/Cys-tRNA(Cys) deacylase
MELSLKRCALEIGAKRVRMATRKEAEAKTGLLAGGISALALVGKPFSVYLDLHAIAWDTIYVSAGQRGFNLAIGVEDLMRVTGAQLVDVASEDIEA